MNFQSITILQRMYGWVSNLTTQPYICCLLIILWYLMKANFLKYSLLYTLYFFKLSLTHGNLRVILYSSNYKNLLFTKHFFVIFFTERIPILE